MKHPLDIDLAALEQLRRRAVAIKAREDAEAADHQRRPAPASRLPLTADYIVRIKSRTPVRHERGYEDLERPV